MSTLRNQMIQQMQLKGYSQKTIRSYTTSLVGLAKHYNASPDLLTVEQIRGYLQYMIIEKKLSKSWMNQMVSALKIFFCEVLRREWNHLDIPRVKRETKLPVVLAREEVKRIIEVTTNLKHRAILILTYSAGLRLSEVRSLKIADIDSKRMLVRVVQAKGFKDRYSVLSPVALDVLRQYWKKYHPAIWLFETRPGRAIAQRSVQILFKKALPKAGIKKEVGFHSLRHSFATHLMEQGVALPVIQQLLGHKSIKTTGIYLHVQQYSIETVKSPADTLCL